MRKNIAAIFWGFIMVACLIGIAYNAGEQAAYRDAIEIRKEALAAIEFDYEVNPPAPIPIGPTLKYEGEEKGWVVVDDEIDIVAPIKKTTDFFNTKFSPNPNGGIFVRGLMYPSWHVTWRRMICND